VEGVVTMSVHAFSCRSCGSSLPEPFLDLGMIPLVNSYRKPSELRAAETFYPLRVHLCDECQLAQLPEVLTPEEMFGDYTYFSSYSDSWLQHAADYCGEMVRRRGINGQHLVVEIASNDGYLLQHFAGRSIPVLGIEPAANVAAAAEEKGIPTITRFFGEETARHLASEGKTADLVIANNVLGHVPQLNDFARGLKILLRPEGLITIEVPHLLRLMAEKQFDTIYHEHLSYFSLHSVERLFAAHDLTVFDVDRIPTHGGSLRLHVGHSRERASAESPHLESVRRLEVEAGLTDPERYASFAGEVEEAKRRLLEFRTELKRQGKSIAGYGAPAKAAVLLNYCGVRSDFIEYTVDRSPHKQGHFLPGTFIPIHHPDRIRETRPDYLLILPWNLKDEIMEQMSVIRDWGGRFLVPVPEVRVHD
jgi:SAM-dependent methyltransferase